MTIKFTSVFNYFKHQFIMENPPWNRFSSSGITFSDVHCSLQMQVHLFSSFWVHLWQKCARALETSHVVGHAGQHVVQWIIECCKLLFKLNYNKMQYWSWEIWFHLPTTANFHYLNGQMILLGWKYSPGFVKYNFFAPSVIYSAHAGMWLTMGPQTLQRTTCYRDVLSDWIT